MRSFIKYLLFTCILLFSEHASYAHTNRNISSLKNSKVSLHNNFDSLLNNPTSTSISSGTEKENDNMSALFVDDDDDDTFKKHLENNNCTNATLFSQTFGSFFDYNKNISFLDNHISYSLSYRYIAFQSFRI